MSFSEDVDTAYQLALFFENLEDNTEQDYIEKKITRTERNKRMKLILEARDSTMAENDPLTKNNPMLKELKEKLRGEAGMKKEKRIVVDSKLWKQFKEICKNMERSPSEAVEEMIREEVSHYDYY